MMNCESSNKRTVMLGTADVRSRGPLFGSGARLPPLNLPSQRNHNPKEPAQLIFTAQCRSASVRAVCQSGSSRVHLLFIYKDPGSALPPENTRTRTKTGARPGVQIHLNAQEIHMLLCICVGLIPRASRLLLFWAAHESEAFTRTVVICDVRTSQPCCWTGSFERIVLNDSKGVL